MRRVRGVDASFSEMTNEEARRLRGAGVEVFAQCLWTAAVRPPVAEQNLEMARANGMTIAGYISVNGPQAGMWHVDRGKETIPQDLWEELALVFIDVELEGIPNRTVREAVDGAAQYGKRRAIYTSYHCWVDFQGNPTDFRDCLLWNAYWDGHPDFDFPSLRYGGWQDHQVVGEQWSGAVEWHGVLVDRDTFDLDLLLPREPRVFKPDPAFEVGIVHAVTDRPPRYQDAVNAFDKCKDMRA